MTAPAPLKKSVPKRMNYWLTNATKVATLLLLTAHPALGAARPTLQCTEIASAGTTADNQKPALVWTYQIAPTGPDTATVTIDGFQTALKIETTTVSKEKNVSYLFKKFADDSIQAPASYKSGEELFTISAIKRDSAQLFFRALRPNLKKKSVPCRSLPPS
jgi:hypothetical protein